ncbi:hypothetical protein IWQ56_002464, partial [Coemansia nantahalensis]
MEPRVLVVSLFAPYTVNFDAAPLSPNGAAQPGRPLTRSGSAGRNSVWSGRRSSMYRTPTTPLGRSAEPHSRRRSTFSVNSFKLSPISRTCAKSPGAADCRGSGDCEGDAPDVTAPQSSAHVAADCAAGNGTLPNADKAGPSQLALQIAEAAGAHTPPANTLDFTRKLNQDQMREKQQRSAGAGKGDRLLRDHLPSHGASDGAAAAGQQGSTEPLAAAIAGLQITNGQSEASAVAVPSAAGGDSRPEEQFTVEHLNVGNTGLFNAVNASLDHFAERV